MTPKFVIYEDSAKEWRFRLVAGNGETIAVSEGYTTKQGAQRGTQAVSNAIIQIIEAEQRVDDHIDMMDEPSTFVARGK
jgi:uncharacterized protein YegP (UPF0339 family)